MNISHGEHGGGVVEKLNRTLRFLVTGWLDDAQAV